MLTNEDPNFMKRHAQDIYNQAAVKKAIVDNENTLGLPAHKKPAALADQLQVPLNYLYSIRRKLIREGALHSRVEKRMANKPKRVFRGGSIIDLNDPDALEILLRDEPILKPIDRLKVLSRLVRLGTPQVKISALKTLEEFSRVSEARVGPPPPSTEDDMVALLGTLLLAIPLSISRRAWKEVHGNDPLEPLQSETAFQPETALQPDDLPVPLTTNQATTELRDLRQEVQREEPLPSSGPLSPDPTDPGPPLQPL